MSSNEISLVELFNKLLLSFFKFIFRYKKIIVGSLFIGVLVGCIFIYWERNHFSAVIIAKTNIYEPAKIVEENKEVFLGHEENISKKEIIYIASTLKSVQKNIEYAKLLNISEHDALNITDIESDTIVNTNFYSIEVTFKNDINLDKLEKGIITYINNSSLVTKCKNEAIEKNKNLTDKIDYELAKIEKLQNKIISESQAVQKSNILFEHYNNFFHLDILEMNVLKQNSLFYLQNATGAEVIQSLSDTKIKKHSAIIILLISLIFSLFTGFVIGYIKDINLKIKKRLNA